MTTAQLSTKEVMSIMHKEMGDAITKLENDKEKYLNEYLGFTEPTMERNRLQGYLFFLDGEIQGLMYALDILEKITKNNKQ